MITPLDTVKTLDPRVSKNNESAASSHRSAWLLGAGAPLVMMALALWQLQRGAAGRPRTAQFVDLTAPTVPSAVFTGLPMLALGLAAAALLLFVLALLALRRNAARAMQSREVLVQVFDTARRWLPWFMLAQTLLVFAAMMCVLGFESLRIFDAHHSRQMRLGMALALLAIFLAWLMLRMVLDMLKFARQAPKQPPIVIMGQQLPRDAAADVWAFVQEVADAVGGHMPDSIVVGLNEGFFVTEYPVALANGQCVPAGRVLYLPVPYVAFMQRDEVAAVIAHELGHFVGEDTQYSLRFLPIYNALVGSVLAITNEHDEDDSGLRELLSRPVSLFGKWFLAEFDHAVQHWSRQRELAADAFASQAAGKMAVAAALLRITALHALIEHALMLNRTASAQQRQPVLATVRALVREQGLASPAVHLDQAQAHPLDTHPPLAQRLAALGVALDTQLLSDATNPSEYGLLALWGLETSSAPASTHPTHS